MTCLKNIKINIYIIITALMDINSDNIHNYTPEEIAEILFNDDPKDPCTFQILGEQTTDNITYIFEILITILLEGLDSMTGGLDKIDLDLFSSDHIDTLNPWFHSMGFTIKINDYEMRELELVKKYYCRVGLNYGNDKKIFEQKNINKNYHFFLNANAIDENSKKTMLKDIYAIFICGNNIYKISFDMYKPLVVDIKKPLL